MAPKRKRTTSDDDDDAAGPSGAGCSTCNFCLRAKQLLPGRRYCASCARDRVECHSCHRPLDEHLMDDNGRCRACNAKRQKQSSLMGAANIIDVSPQDVGNSDPLLFAQASRETTRIEVENSFLHFKGVKWYLVMIVKMIKYNREGEEVIMDVVFHSELETMLLQTDFDLQFDRMFDAILQKIKDFVKLGSGWSVLSVERLELHVAPYLPISASSYVATPSYIAQKKAIVNIQNEDNFCFLWSILAALHPAPTNPCRTSNYEAFKKDLNIANLKFPLAVSDVIKFEKLNTSISVNVFAFEGRSSSIYPVHITSFKGRQHHANLLLIVDDKTGKSHYTLIRNMSRLLGDRTKYNGVTYYCDYCLHGFIRQDLLDNHVEDCKKFGMQKITLPKEEEKFVTFKAIEKQLPVPVIVYADFESFTTKIQKCENPSSSTDPYELHVPSGYSFYIISSHPKFKPVFECYHGPDVVERFLRRLKEEYQKIEQLLSQIEPMIITKEQEQKFRTVKDCYLCKRPLGTDRVRDHCHMTGLYRGAAHGECNLKLKYRGRTSSTDEKKRYRGYIVPVVFHNLRGYDGHLIMKGFKKEIFPNEYIQCIPNNMERYISFTIGNLRFIDSFQFMAESLDKLSSNLKKENFTHTAMQNPADKLHLLLRKGVFPYEYWDSIDRFDEPQLPPKEAFYSRLTDQTITDEDYCHAQQVWKEFNMQKLVDYHDLYLKTDVLLLCDVFENFRATCMQHYKLDPAHYFSAPGLAWDAMLKMTGVELELMVEREFHDIIDKGTRGGICCISRKFARANNKYHDDYDASKSSSYIIYLDMNNLYGTAMIQPLPQKDFEFMNDEQLKNFDFLSVPVDSCTGYILEVDLEYDDTLHHIHNDYPLCPENVSIVEEDLSSYTKLLAEKLEVKIMPTKKLVCNLKDKKKYVIHYRNLQLYVKLGIRVTRIHRVIEFTQSRWLKPYIDFNTERRKDARSEFEKDFFKLMNNSVFGKTMENVRNHQDVKLVHNVKQFKKLTAKPNFKSFKIFTEDLTAVHMAKQDILLNKPTYVGMSILDISKTFMYEFHYNHIKSTYGNRAALLMTDTDSLVYSIETDDLYDDMCHHLDLYDTSEYPSDHPAYSTLNKKMLGKMKDEMKGCPIKEFVGLRPKMYSVLEGDGSEKKTAKGINKSVTRKIRHEQYFQALFGEQRSIARMTCIRSYKHEVMTVNIKKVGLSPYDDKRYVLADKVTTLAHGHCSITKQ